MCDPNDKTYRTPTCTTPAYCEQCKTCPEVKRLNILLAKKEVSLKQARDEAIDLRGQLIRLTQKVIY